MLLCGHNSMSTSAVRERSLFTSFVWCKHRSVFACRSTQRKVFMNMLFIEHSHALKSIITCYSTSNTRAVTISRASIIQPAFCEKLAGLGGGNLTSPVSTEQALRPEQLRKSREPLATLPFLPPQTLALFTPKLARIGGNKDAMSGWRGSTRHDFRVAAHSSFPFLDAPSLCGIYDRYSAALSP